MHTVSIMLSFRIEGKLTVGDDEEVDAENRKTLAGSVVGVLELSLHDCCINLYHDDARQPGEDHPGAIFSSRWS